MIDVFFANEFTLVVIGKNKSDLNKTSQSINKMKTSRLEKI